MIKRDDMDSKPEFTFFSIDCEPESDLDKHDINHLKSAPVSPIIHK